jgi:HK97 family phage prohead protease
MIRLTPSQITVDAAAAEGLPSRSISGVAVTYDETATISDGTKVRFLQGSLPVTGRDPKLYMQHDANQIVGKVTERVDTPQGMMFTAKISATRLGDEALTLANDGVIDAVSVGVTPTKFSYDEEGVMIVEAANWSELSLVSEGAFSGAIIERVAASAPDEPVETPAESIHQTEPAVELISEQDTTKETDMTDKIETPVVEAAAATVEKLWAQPKQEFKMPTPGEYAAAMTIGGDTFRKVNEAYKIAAAKSQSALQFALAQDLTTDTPGLLPTPVLGNIFLNYNAVRPVVSAIGTRAMPNGNGKSFIRPIITQHTSAAVQTEGSQVDSQKMTLSSNTVTRQTVAGGVFISQQDMDFTDPNALNAILTDLQGQYLKATDDIAADACVTAKQASGFTWTVTAGDPTTLMAALYGCAFNISNSTNLFATHLLVSVDVWQKLGGQLDADKRPLFPAIGAPGLIGQNTLGAGSAASWSGMNPMGLEIVVDGNFASGTMLVVHAPAIEFYEQQRGIMRVQDPALLGENFSYYGYFATFFQDATDATAGSRFVQAITVA